MFKCNKCDREFTTKGGLSNHLLHCGNNEGDLYKRIVIKNKEMLVHRILMEKILGRKLREDEVVHHKDGIRGNNNIDNLEVMTISEHIKLHRKKENVAERVRKQLKTRKENSTIFVGCCKAKLSENEVKEIKIRLRNGEKTVRLVDEFNVASTTIDNIKHGHSWKRIKI